MDIISLNPRARFQADIKRKIYWEILFKGIILLLIITSQSTLVQHNKMICSVRTLACIIRVTGHDNNALNMHNHRPIQKSVHHDKTMYRICPRLRSQVIFAAENLLQDYNLLILALRINVHHNKTMCYIKALR